MSEPFKIVFEDTHLVVLEKSAGLLSQSDISGVSSLVDLLRIHFGRHFVGLVHRLDRNTSGLMVVAKRSKSAERLTEALQSGQLQRRYCAILVGKLEKPAKWSHSLQKDANTNKVRVVASDSENSKTAVLSVSPKSHFKSKSEEYTLAEFLLETGRSHQIRAQSAAMGFPLLGDLKYGTKASSVFGRPALHSYFLQFPHPMSKDIMKFESPLPADMQNFIPKL